LKGVIVVYNVYDLSDLPSIPSGNDVFLVVCKGEETISGNFETTELHIFRTSARYCVPLVSEGYYDFTFDGGLISYSYDGEEKVDVSEILLEIAKREDRNFDKVRKNVKVIKHY